jgi:hypothetical protein
MHGTSFLVLDPLAATGMDLMQHGITLGYHGRISLYRYQDFAQSKLTGPTTTGSNGAGMFHNGTMRMRLRSRHGDAP